jgi:hypothetical protein
LAAETDEAAIRRTLRQLDLDDIELGRALEVIKERKFALQDLDDAERDLADARAERAEEEAQRQQEASDKLQEALFAEQEARIKADEKTLQTEQEIQDARISNAKQLNDLAKTFAGDNENAQKALLAVQKSIAISEILINTERQISGIRADEDKTDAQKTTQVAQARVSSALSVATVLATNSAYDGVENTGAGGKGDDRGGMLWMLHPEERVMTRKQNIKVGGLSNDELADMAMMYNKGHLVNPMTDLALSVTNKQDKQVDKTHLVVNKLNSLQEAIENRPVQQVNVDSFGNIIETAYKKGLKTVITHKQKDRL